MGSDSTDTILVEPEEIPDYLTGKKNVGEGGFIVRCEDVVVSRYEDGKIAAVACDHPTHGCHPRYRERYARVHELLAKLQAKSGDPAAPCAKCGGSGWLATDSAEARHAVLLSTLMGMWRGIKFKPRGLPMLQAGDTMEAILKGHKPADASSTPGQEGCS